MGSRFVIKMAGTVIIKLPSDSRGLLRVDQPRLSVLRDVHHDFIAKMHRDFGLAVPPKDIQDIRIVEGFPYSAARKGELSSMLGLYWMKIKRLGLEDMIHGVAHETAHYLHETYNGINNNGSYNALSRQQIVLCETVAEYGAYAYLSGYGRFCPFENAGNGYRPVQDLFSRNQSLLPTLAVMNVDIAWKTFNPTFSEFEIRMFPWIKGIRPRCDPRQ
jgi:hypothetical protein